jgi:hypothetical protein
MYGASCECRTASIVLSLGGAPKELIDAATEELENESLEWVPVLDVVSRRKTGWIAPCRTTPYLIYLDSYRHAGDLLAEVGNDDGGHLINRLTFAHHVTALEAYLGEGTIRQLTGGLTAQ